MILVAFTLVYGGLLGLALGMKRSQSRMLAAPLSLLFHYLARVFGWFLLSVAALLCTFGWGVSIGLTVWFGLVAFAAAVLTLLLAYRPKGAFWTEKRSVDAGWNFFWTGFPWKPKSDF